MAKYHQFTVDTEEGGTSRDDPVLELSPTCQLTIPYLREVYREWRKNVLRPRQDAVQEQRNIRLDALAKSGKMEGYYEAVMQIHRDLPYPPHPHFADWLIENGHAKQIDVEYHELY